MRKLLPAQTNKLKNAFKKFLESEISYNELKKYSAPFGIYQQRNKKFMMRIRTSAGILTPEKLYKIADAARKADIDYAYLTNRQNIQLHGINPELVEETLNFCNQNELIFNGGGGDTYRNITASSDSQSNEKAAFDILPIIEALHCAISKWDIAFSLPRKIKIGFAAGEYDNKLALTQDLGFIAVKQNNQKGFKVYGGGGIGKNHYASGILLFDFLPAEKINHCTQAMIKLFSDHGDRETRAKARLRYVKEKIGDENFKKLFFEYYDKKINTPDLFIENIYSKISQKETSEYNNLCEKNSAFENWQTIAVKNSAAGRNMKSIQIFIPYGRLSANNLEKLANIAATYNYGYFRLTRDQNILLPQVNERDILALYSKLKNNFSDIDLLFQSFKGNISSCTGATVCAIGILDSQKIADLIAEKLDKQFESQPALKAKHAREIIKMIRISGCPNSCSANPAATIGLSGLKKRIDNKITELYKISQKTNSEELFNKEKDIYETSEAADQVIEMIKAKFNL